MLVCIFIWGTFFWTASAYTKWEKQEQYKKTRDCIEHIESFSQNAPEIQPYIQKMKDIEKEDLLEHPEATEICRHILRSLEDRVHRQQKYALQNSIQKWLLDSQEVRMFYDMTWVEAEITPYLEKIEIIQDIYEKNIYSTKLDVGDWKGLHLQMESLNDSIQYSHDAFLRTQTPSRDFWEEFERYKKWLITPPPSTHPELKQLVVVDLSDQMTYAYEWPYLIQSNLVTTGQDKYPTYPGEYSVLEKLQWKWMNSPFPDDEYRLWVDYWIRISYSGYGLHDTCNSVNCWRTEYGPDQNHRVHGSHGCINTPKTDIITLYDWIEIGTKVIVQE